MNFIYNKTSIGYSHLNKNIVCQDYSDYFINHNYKIITACDGHGGKLYIRSDRGAKYASDAVISVFINHSKKEIKSLIEKDGLNKLKLEILCKWNELIERDYSKENFNEEELANLDEEEIFKLTNNFVIAYGSTLNAVVLMDEFVICIQIGDGGIFLLKENDITNAIPENDGNVANITNSLCGDKAYRNLYISVFNKDDYDGTIICTDGLLSPYQTYNNFKNSFVIPIVDKVISRDIINEIDDFINELGTNIGNGDDVSLGMLFW